MASTVAAWKRHMLRRGLAGSTVERRMSSIRAFEIWLNGSATGAATEQVESFLDSRRIAAGTRYCWISHLHMFYKWAVAEGLALDDPTATIERPKIRRRLPRPCTDDQLATALDQAPPTMRAWLSLAAFAGLRCAEIARLDVEDVILAEGQLRVQGKGGKDRIVPVHPRVAEVLAAYGMPRRGPVFVRPRGGRYPAAMVSREISVYMADLGLPVTAHQLRHWFASRTLDGCGDLRVVQELLGHSSPTTTAIYTQFSQRRAAAAVAALPEPVGRLEGVGA